MWTCPNCHERIDDCFDACWNCGTDRTGNVDPDFEPLAADFNVPDPGPEVEPIDPENTSARIETVADSDVANRAFSVRGAALRDAPPGIASLASPGSEFRLVTLASFWHPAEAWMAKNRLAATGIAAFVADEHLPEMYWVACTAVDGVKVQVRPRDFTTARTVLAEDRSPVFHDLQPSLPGLVCNACGSTEIYVERYSRRAAFLFWLIFGFPWAFRRTTLRCLECGHCETAEDFATRLSRWQFSIRDLLVLTFVLALLLSLGKSLGLDWLNMTSCPITFVPSPS